ncbi:MAG: DUF748 domain-containing protein [Burkholderiales bacterium]|nr:DUF748 domain-containing protein [Burkholderiales bacterium]
MSETAPRYARLRTLLLSKPALVAGALLLLYTLLGFFAAPWLVRHQLPGLVEQQFGAQGSVGTVRINPFLLTVEANDLTIAEKTGDPVFSIRRLFVDFETSSLLRWAWTFREIRLEQPVVNAELDVRESLNIARLFAPRSGQATEKPAEPSKTPRLLLQHVVISGGVFRFTDQTLQPAAVARFDPVDFEIQDLATLPDHDGEHRLSARLPGGGSLQWQGKLSLAPFDSSGSLELKEGKLATLWRFAQDRLALAEPAGAFTIGLSYQLGYREGALDLRAEDLSFRLKDLALAKPGGEQLAGLAALALENGSFDLQKRSVAFGQVRIGEGKINLALDRDGSPDWGRLVREPANTGKPTEPDTAESATAPRPAWQLSLPKVAIGPLALSITDHSRVAPLRLQVAQAEAGFGLEARTGGQLQVSVTEGSIALRELQAIPGDAKEAPLTLASAELAGGSFDLQKQAIRVENIRLSGGRSEVMRDAEGAFPLLRMFAPLKDSPTEKTGFSTVIDRIELSDYTVALSDQGFQPPLAYELEKISVSAGSLSMPPEKPLALELSLQVKQGGTLRAKGSVDLKQQAGDLKLELAGLALAPLETVLRQQTTLTLVSGQAGSSGQLRWSSAKQPAVHYAGDATINDLELKTAASNEKLFSWQRFAASGIDYNSGDNRLSVSQLSLSRPYARLVINKDRSTNLAAIRRPAPTKAAAADPAAGSGLAVNIDRVSVERGNMDFTDLSLVLPFSTYIQSLGGSISGLSSAPESRASLKFEGRIEDYGLARAEGAIQPFAPKKFTDIAVVFRNVELTPMSPYTATFAGRKIASGKLSLDLQYKLDNSKLAGDNKVLLEQFTLGERVESPTAVNLPLDLAIALLTDSSGRIDLAIPVSGDVDNPEFSYGHVVWQAIRTVITRIVTAPFRALGALFGGNAEDLGDIVFDPGSARILPTEYEKLRRVAEGLQKRPQLKLVIQGLYHKDSDSRALRALAVRADLATREGLKLAPGEDPGPVGFDNAKTQRALEMMLEARAGGNAVAQFTETYRKTAGREAPRVNPVLAVMSRGAGDRELYVAMHQRLIELQPLADSTLPELAQSRADSIVRAFTTRLKFDAARLGGKPAAAAEETIKNGVPLKLSFEPMPSVAAVAPQPAATENR